MSAVSAKPSLTVHQENLGTGVLGCLAAVLAATEADFRGWLRPISRPTFTRKQLKNPQSLGRVVGSTSDKGETVGSGAEPALATRDDPRRRATEPEVRLVDPPPAGTVAYTSARSATTSPT